MRAPDSVVAALRGDILDGRLAPGSTVTEAYVAGAHDVARPTARTAIDRLVDAGLLVREPHAAARVPRLGRDDLHDLFTTRAALEATAAELLAATATVPPAAAQAHATLLALPPDDPYAPTDIAFHRALVEGTGSVRLPRLHGQLMGEIELGIAQIDAERLRSPEDVADEHQRILDAIAAGDVAGAGALARAHVLSSRDRLVAHHDATHREA